MRTLRLEAMAALTALTLAGCGSHMMDQVAQTPTHLQAGGAVHDSGSRLLVTPSGTYLQACGPQADPRTERCYAMSRPAAFGQRPLYPTSNGFYGPSDLQSMYKLPSATRGKKVLVAIVDAYDDPNLEADLGTYRSNYGLSACTIASGCLQKLNQQGQAGPYPQGDAGWGEEESLDVDMVSAICPNCRIMMIEANSSNLSDLASSVDEAAALGAHVISTSWGNGEFNGETGYDYYFNLPGVMITVASGDGAYVAGTQYPASNPWVTTVGGTTPIHATNSRGWSETPWYFPQNNPPQGGGSGCSIYETGRKQSWQKDPSCATRMYSDVAAVANSVAGYDSYGVSPGWYSFFGTSVASPVVAGIYGLANNASTLTYGSQSYSQPTGVWDIKQGNTGTCQITYFCTAGPGYDGPTGNGTPHGIKAF